MLKIKLLTNKEFPNFEKIFSQYKEQKINYEDVIGHVFNQVYVAYHDEQLIGFIVFAIIYDRCELLDLYVDPDYRHQGIAERLMQTMIEKVDSCSNISLEVCRDNNAAYHLYSKFGFKTVAVRERYYHGTDGYLMVKEVKK
ncbi:MAG: ribosomal protein S18-alanine N-acetyltransferase [Bacilli bacterium]